jgi:hypothetical protein
LQLESVLGGELAFSMGYTLSLVIILMLLETSRVKRGDILTREALGFTEVRKILIGIRENRDREFISPELNKVDRLCMRRER